MERFVERQNIEHYQEMLRISTDPAQRRLIKTLLLEEKIKLKISEADRKKR
jgi:hypothetical protein